MALLEIAIMTMKIRVKRTPAIEGTITKPKIKNPLTSYKI